jgi:hypothetical protein
VDEPNDRLLGIIERAVTGGAVDWASLIAQAESEEERVWIRNLREISRIAAHCRVLAARPRGPARRDLVRAAARVPATSSRGQAPTASSLPQPFLGDRASGFNS